MRYAVFNNGRLAQYPDCPNVDQSWNKGIHETFEGAKGYAKAWLGFFSPVINDIEVNEPIDYSGFGDIIEIREVKDSD